MGSLGANEERTESMALRLGLREAEESRAGFGAAQRGLGGDWGQRGGAAG